MQVFATIIKIPENLNFSSIDHRLFLRILSCDFIENAANRLHISPFFYQFVHDVNLISYEIRVALITFEWTSGKTKFQVIVDGNYHCQAVVFHV